MPVLPPLILRDRAKQVLASMVDAGYMTDQEKADLEAFIKRGGGLVILHDSLCGPDPEYFASLVGGAKKHGERNTKSLKRLG